MWFIKAYNILKENKLLKEENRVETIKYKTQIIRLKEKINNLNQQINNLTSNERKKELDKLFNEALPKRKEKRSKRIGRGNHGKVRR